MNWRESFANEVDAIHLHGTCVHEAGHAAVARHLGCYAYWQVSSLPNGSFNPETGHRWVGRCWNNAGAFPVSIGRKIGLAGVVAEYVSDNPGASPYAVEFLIANEILLPSSSDWDMAAGYTFRELSETVRLVRKLMPKIRGEVECFLLDMGKEYV